MMILVFSLLVLAGCDRTVTPVNNLPVIINPIADVTVNAGTASTILDLAGTFDDVDIGTNSDALTLSIDDNSNPDLVTATLADSTLALDFQLSQLGTATITVRATDNAGAFVDACSPFTRTLHAPFFFGEHASHPRHRRGRS